MSLDMAFKDFCQCYCKQKHQSIIRTTGVREIYSYFEDVFELFHNLGSCIFQMLARAGGKRHPENGSCRSRFHGFHSEWPFKEGHS